ncbi:hypothetical protein C4D60_Mb11t01380 [Musa balbisiana]|uniref:Uncharacterized protein n=1 Tax=Musa balbisiana TaxID=52838 RepID=A0A4S8J0Z1_MUSBA|nr:hypothetical protein C4D60_Mb11t01380 [Musa balbisiana]
MGFISATTQHIPLWGGGIFFKMSQKKLTLQLLFILSGIQRQILVEGINSLISFLLVGGQRGWVQIRISRDSVGQTSGWLRQPALVIRSRLGRCFLRDGGFVPRRSMEDPFVFIPAHRSGRGTRPNPFDDQGAGSYYR